MSFSNVQAWPRQHGSSFALGLSFLMQTTSLIKSLSEMRDITSPCGVNSDPNKSVLIKGAVGAEPPAWCTEHLIDCVGAASSSCGDGFRRVLITEAAEDHDLDLRAARLQT